MSDIFISYASQDRPVAQRLASALADEGWSVWWDRAIMPGKSFARMIEDALDDSRCVVVLWSGVSRDSDWVQNEARHGHERRVLIPAVIEDVKPPFEFRHIHAAPLADWDGDMLQLGYRQLIAAISDLVGAPPEREEASENAPETERSERDLAEEEARNRSFLEAVRRHQAKLLGDRKGPEPAPAGNKVAGRVDPPDFSVFRDVDEPWCPEIVVLPADEFMMGSPETDKDAEANEKPQHKVTIGTRFAVGRYPVNFEEYDLFCEATGQDKPKDSDWGRGRRPVINVSWDEARAYAEWLGEETSKKYRLLREAEWEYACRAGTTTRYSCGDTIAGKDADFSTFGTTEAGSYPANPWGLYDLHGNVWEWVEDVWHDNYMGAPDDGSAWTADGDSSHRVLRGGSWNNYPRDLRSANRSRGTSDVRDYLFGFRVARTL